MYENFSLQDVADTYGHGAGHAPGFVPISAIWALMYSKAKVYLPDGRAGHVVTCDDYDNVLVSVGEKNEFYSPGDLRMSPAAIKAITAVGSATAPSAPSVLSVACSLEADPWDVLERVREARHATWATALHTFLLWGDRCYDYYLMPEVVADLGKAKAERERERERTIVRDLFGDYTCTGCQQVFACWARNEACLTGSFVGPTWRGPCTCDGAARNS